LLLLLGCCCWDARCLATPCWPLLSKKARAGLASGFLRWVKIFLWHSLPGVRLTHHRRGGRAERRNVVRANHKVFLLVVARVCRREHTNNPACGGRAVSQMREHDRAIVEEENPGRASDVFSDRQHGHARGIMSVDTTKPQRVEWWRAGAGDDPPEPHTPPRPGWPLRRV